MKTQKQFRPDAETTDEGKNGVLAGLLMGAWNKLAIVKVARVKARGEEGWQVTHQE